MDKRAPGFSFWTFLALGVLAAVASVALGGAGMDADDGGYYSGQALTLLAGFTCMAASVFMMGEVTTDSAGKDLRRVANASEQVAARLQKVKDERENSQKEIDVLKNDVRALRSELRKSGQGNGICMP